MHTCRIEELLREKNVAAISDEEYKVPETPAYVIVYSKRSFLYRISLFGSCYKNSICNSFHTLLNVCNIIPSMHIP